MDKLSRRSEVQRDDIYLRFMSIFTSISIYKSLLLYLGKNYTDDAQVVMGKLIIRTTTKAIRNHNETDAASSYTTYILLKLYITTISKTICRLSVVIQFIINCHQSLSLYLRSSIC